MAGSGTGEETDGLSLIPCAVPWVHEAGNPYYDWLFGSAERARETLARWMARSTSEITVAALTGLFVEDDLAGGYVACPGEAVSVRRFADGQALLREFRGPERQALRARLMAVVDLFLPAEPDGYYLSKIGLLQHHRGKGYGQQLVEAYLAEGCARGYTKYFLDVSADNLSAILLYREFGFYETARRTSADGELTYARLCLTVAPP